MAKALKPFSDQIRDAIDRSGMSRYAICRETGIDKALLSRFMSGAGGLSVASLDAIGKLLKFRVTSERPIETGKQVDDES